MQITLVERYCRIKTSTKERSRLNRLMNQPEPAMPRGFDVRLSRLMSTPKPGVKEN
jgi:hypothetical protein